MKMKDLTGQKFHRLEVLQRDGKLKWLCQCDCGKVTSVGHSNLKRGVSKSCGCLRKEIMRGKAKHGHARKEAHSRLYRIWCSMKNRCLNENNESFEDYGGRGIGVDISWSNSFQMFSFWAETSEYCDGLQIDRIDNSASYGPDNCRWVTPGENSLNRRNNVYIEVNGARMTVSQASRELGVNYHNLYDRVIRHGWDIEDAVNVPLYDKRN
jgi:hypothetical protein